MAVAIFPPTIIALVAMRNQSIIVPLSPMSQVLLLSMRVIKYVVGIMTTRSVRRNREFSWIRGSQSVIESFIASHAIMIKLTSPKLPVSPGIPSEKFRELKTRTYQKTVTRSGI